MRLGFERVKTHLPKKGRRIERKLILLLQDGEGRYAIRRRPEKGLLAGLWELPQIELAEDIAFTDEAALDALARRFCSENGLHAEESVALPTAKHIFTHIEWHMCGRYLNIAESNSIGCGIKQIGYNHSISRFCNCG